MKLTSFIYGLLAFIIVISSFSLFIADINSGYPVAIESNFTEKYDRIAELEQQAIEFQAAELNETGVEPTIADVLGNILTKAITSVKLSVTSMDVGIDMVGDAGNDLGLPPVFMAAIVTAIIVFIIIGVILSAKVKKDL